MSDIFLNYVLDDLDKAEKLRDAFRLQGWTVWRCNPNDLFYADRNAELVKELKAAKVIVTLWSHYAARESSIVRKTLKLLSPALPVIVLLDKSAYPPAFVSVQPYILSDWDGSESHLELQNLIRYLRKLIGPSSVTDKPPISLWEDFSGSEIQENARRGIEASAAALKKDDARFSGVFISYRRNEAAAYARGLYDRFVKSFGAEKVFLDLKNVGLGEDFVEAITAAAESCSVMIALISPRWSRGSGAQAELDDYVRLEVSKALGRKIRVIPILIQGASMPAPKDLPEDLSPLVRRNALALSDDARWERDVEDLIKNLEGLLKD